MTNFLFVGLGNPGPEYELTRHNIGFLVMDRLASLKQVQFSPNRYGDKTEFKHAGKTFHLVKPNTFMNLSGKAVQYWLTQTKVPIENLAVATDDIALPFGKTRLRPQGSHGGHNGLRNIQEVLGKENYARLRIGVGNDFPKGQQADYVLSSFNELEMKGLVPLLDRCVDCLISFAQHGMSQTMTKFNQ